MARRFRLASVLNHRRHLEEAAHKTFSVVSRKWTQACNDLEVMRRNRRRYQRDLKGRMQANAPAAELVLYQRYLSRIHGEIEAQKHVVQNLAADREAKRAMLLTAVKNRKIIEKLKERFVENEERRRHLEEQKLLSEAALNRYQGNPGVSD